MSEYKGNIIEGMAIACSYCRMRNDHYASTCPSREADLERTMRRRSGLRLAKKRGVVDFIAAPKNNALENKYRFAQESFERSSTPILLRRREGQYDAANTDSLLEQEPLLDQAWLNRPFRLVDIGKRVFLEIRLTRQCHLVMDVTVSDDGRAFKHEAMQHLFVVLARLLEQTPCKLRLAWWSDDNWSLFQGLFLTVGRKLADFDTTAYKAHWFDC